MPWFKVHINMGYCGTDTDEYLEFDTQADAEEYAYQSAIDMISTYAEPIDEEDFCIKCEEEKAYCDCEDEEDD